MKPTATKRPGLEAALSDARITYRSDSSDTNGVTQLAIPRIGVARYISEQVHY